VMEQVRENARGAAFVMEVGLDLPESLSSDTRSGRSASRRWWWKVECEVIGHQAAVDVRHGAAGQVPHSGERSRDSPSAVHLPALHRRVPFGADEAAGQVGVPVGGAEVACCALIVDVYPARDAVAAVVQGHVECLITGGRLRRHGREQHRRSQEQGIIQVGGELADVEFLAVAVGDRDVSSTLAVKWPRPPW
jgi:hypothetical protein